MRFPALCFASGRREGSGHPARPGLTTRDPGSPAHSGSGLRICDIALYRIPFPGQEASPDETSISRSGQMDRNVFILFSARILRLFCYGFLSVILALYFAQIGLPERQIGLLFTLTLAGDAGISLWLTTSADRFGRKRTLIVGALLMAGAGVVFIVTRQRPPPPGRRHHRRHQSERQRDRAVPLGGTGRPGAAPPERKTHADVRLVQPRRILRDRGGRTVRRLAGSRAAVSAGCPRSTRIAPS